MKIRLRFAIEEIQSEYKSMGFSTTSAGQTCNEERQQGNSRNLAMMGASHAW